MAAISGRDEVPRLFILIATGGGGDQAHLRGGQGGFKADLHPEIGRQEP